MLIINYFWKIWKEVYRGKMIHNLDTFSVKN